MTIYSQSFEGNEVVSLDTREALIQEVQHGLAERPRSLAPWMFYDVHGSHLFDRITQLPEYYLTRTERRILARNAEHIIAAVLAPKSQRLRIVELGAGVASKTGILLNAALRAQCDVVYLPLDVPAEALELARRSTECTYPEVRVEPTVVNYITHPPQLEPFDGATLMLYLGSSIGNFSREEARTILRNGRSQIRPGDAFLLGADLVKEESRLMAAYDDSGGVTAAFNVNILHRLNRELNADFDPARFQHCVRWNAVESRIEMHLESTSAQDVSIALAQLDIHPVQGETIHTENSYKFTDESIRSLMRNSGFEISEVWRDEHDPYAVVLARSLTEEA